MCYSNKISSNSDLKANPAEVLALLKILALGNKQVMEGRVKPLGEVIGQLRKK